MAAIPPIIATGWSRRRWPHRRDSVVVSMLTSGSGAVQKAVAAAQNSKLGTGGSKHRHLSAGEWVDHGHHALMRISAFTAVGGYDETLQPQ